MFGFTNSETYGFAAPVTWGPMVVGLVGIVWFVLRNLRAGKRYREAVAKDKSALPQPPLLDLEVLKNRSFTVGTITASLAFFASVRFWSSCRSTSRLTAAIRPR